MKKLIVLLAVGASVLSAQVAHAAVDTKPTSVEESGKPPCPFMAKKANWTDSATAKITPPAGQETKTATVRARDARS